jgi:hypothetical protein
MSETTQDKTSFFIFRGDSWNRRSVQSKRKEGAKWKR